MPSYDNPLTLGRGTVAVVTGAGSGMGRELALVCARRGCHVAGCDVNQEPMAETVALCKAAAPDPSAQRFYGHVCDVSSAEACVGFSEATAAEFGVPHINILLYALHPSSSLRAFSQPPAAQQQRWLRRAIPCPTVCPIHASPTLSTTVHHRRATHRSSRTTTCSTRSSMSTCTASST